MRIIQVILSIFQAWVNKTPAPGPVIPVDPTPTPNPNPPVPNPGVPTDPLIQEIHTLINRERTNRGLQPLKFDSRVQTAADKYARLMARQDRLSHTLDSDVGTRISREGYRWSTCGENIAWNYSGAASVVQGWMNSSGHRRNILNGSFKDTGISVSVNGNGPYYCQVFAA